MADISQLERLDQQFPWQDDPLQSELRRLMSTLEPRFINLENKIVDWEAAVENITQLGVARVNEVLGPLLEQLNAAAQLGFLVAYASDFENTMELDEPFGIVINSAGKELFTPTPRLTIQDIDTPTNWGEAELQSYDPNTGDLTVTMRYVATGITGENWVVSCGSGVLQATVDASAAAVAAKDDVEDLADQFAGDLATLQTLIASLSTGAVVSVATKTGIVTLVPDDIVGLQALLDAKATTSYVNTQVAAKQAASAKLTALSDLSWSTDNLLLLSGSSSVTVQPISTFMKTLMDDVDAAAARTTLAITSPTPATDAEIRASTGSGPITSGALATSSAAVTLTDAATVAIDWNTFIHATLTITANRILGNPTNGKPGTSRTILLQTNSSTVRALSLGNQYLGTIPTLTSLNNVNWYLLTIFCVTTTHFVVTAVKAK